MINSHYTGPGLGTGQEMGLETDAEMLTLVWDNYKNQQTLFPIMQVPIHVLPLVWVLCTVNKPKHLQAIQEIQSILFRKKQQQ